MTSVLWRILRRLRGPAGGMLACLLLAAMLGGVASADPGRVSADPSGSAETPPAQADAGDQGGSDVRFAEGGAPVSHTAADCTAAIAKVAQTADDQTGLANAIAHVEANCERNPQAPGLLVALEHLVQNQARHAEGEAGGESADHRTDGEHGQSEHGSSNETHGSGDEAESDDPDQGSEGQGSEGQGSHDQGSHDQGGDQGSGDHESADHGNGS